MHCTLCGGNKELPIVKGKIVEHLLITKDTNGHYHIHGPLDKKQEILSMIILLCKHSNIDLKKTMEPEVEAVPVTKKHFEDKMLSTEQKRFRKQYDTTQTYRDRLP